jgi:hypothetical protein
MHKYFNFAKIFEAEQAGEPLNPEEMGTPAAPEANVSATPTQVNATVSSTDEPAVLNFEELAKTHILDALFTKAEVGQLEKDGTLLKPDAKFMNKDTSLDVVTVSMKISIAGRQTTGSQDDPDAIAFVISEDQFKDMKDGMVGGTYQSSFVTGDTAIPVPVRFNLDQSVDAQPAKAPTGVAPSDNQILSGSVPAAPVEGTITTPEEGVQESRGIMTFSQFVNEAKKDKWIADVTKDMKKGALRKEMGMKKGEKMNLSDLEKSEAKLKKKDKDKKKPGLQLDKKDAKTHKRNTLAKNLIKASRGK